MKKLFALALLSAAAPPAWAQTGQGPWHMHGWGMGWGGGMVLGPLLIIGLVILLIALIVPFIRSIGGGGAGPRTPSARDILDARYAQGEIDREEYLRRRNDIAGEQ
jgi:putative membrane protein